MHTAKKRARQEQALKLALRRLALWSGDQPLPEGFDELADRDAKAAQAAKEVQTLMERLGHGTTV